MQHLCKLKARGMSIVIVLHDLGLAANYCDGERRKIKAR